VGDTLTIARGGTEATTAPGARANLGISDPTNIGVSTWQRHVGRYQEFAGTVSFGVGAIAVLPVSSIIFPQEFATIPSVHTTTSSSVTLGVAGVTTVHLAAIGFNPLNQSSGAVTGFWTASGQSAVSRSIPIDMAQMYIICDDNGYITTMCTGGILKDGIGCDYYDFKEELGAYKYENDCIILDEKKLAEIKKEQAEFAKHVAEEALLPPVNERIKCLETNYEALLADEKSKIKELQTENKQQAQQFETLQREFAELRKLVSEKS